MSTLVARLPLRLTEVAAVLAALVVGYLVVDHADIVGGDLPPFVRSAGQGQVAHLSYADVRVAGVTTARYLVPQGLDTTPLAASGVFLLTTVALRPTREPITFEGIWLEDDEGRLFRPSARSGCTNQPATDTGITTYAVLCFEVPPSLLDQYRLEVARGDDTQGDTRNDDVADLSLGLTATRAAALASPTRAYEVVGTSTAPITLTPTTVTGSS